MFMLCKLKYLNEKTGKPFVTSVRKLNFAEIDKSDLIYNDKLIKLYQCATKVSYANKVKFATRVKFASKVKFATKF